MAAKSGFKKDQPAPLDYTALTRELRERGVQNLYLLWGEEEYLLADFVKMIRKACLGDGDDAFNAKRIDGAEPNEDDIAEALNAMPFFGERTYVELRGFDVNKCREESTMKLFSDIPEWCTVVIILPTGMNPDGRLTFIKNLKKAGKAVQFTAQDNSKLRNWISRRFEACGKIIGFDAIDRLIFISGNLMTRLIPEITKIAGYVQSERITVQDIEKLAHHIPEATAFEMTDAIADRNYDTAMNKLAELLAGDSAPAEIMGSIGWQIRQLYTAKIAEKAGRGMEYLKEVLGTNSDYRIKMLSQSAKKFTLPALTNGVRLCAEYAMKPREFGSAIDDTEAIKEFFIRFAMECRHA